MKIAISILTFNRIGALNKLLVGLQPYFKKYTIAVFEDCGCADRTCSEIRRLSKPTGVDKEVLAERWQVDWISFFLGTRNLGVAGNSNRALKWFERINYDYLCLCNDDLEVLGDFPEAYCKTMPENGVDFACFRGDYPKGLPLHPGYQLSIQEILSGCMMVISKKCLETVGYFDTSFGKFGNEHCDYSTRCSLAGLTRGRKSLDLGDSDKYLKLQNVACSIDEGVKKRHLTEANNAYGSFSYLRKELYRPFKLFKFASVGNEVDGIPTDKFMGYELIHDNLVQASIAS
jgi:GT2 family glycosyltransferase